VGVIGAYRLRLERRRWQIRAIRKRRELSVVKLRKGAWSPGDILVFLTIRDELVRLPYFLDYYRKLGASHFFVVDNDSSDGSLEYLAEQPDVSTWHTDSSYRGSRYGTDWLNWLKLRYARGHWTLTLDPDEFLVYPFCDTRPLPALCSWLDQSDLRSFGTMMLDMYSKDPPERLSYDAGRNPFEDLKWFDPANYVISRNPKYRNLWIQGGPRARAFFADRPEMSPSLNKTPLVKWDPRYVFISSTHMLLPRGLNQTYDEAGGEKTTGCLLHAKFLDVSLNKVRDPQTRAEHFARGREYDAYATAGGKSLWGNWSKRYAGWAQLEELGLMSKGNWA
jgi:hypothetical protein